MIVASCVIKMGKHLLIENADDQQENSNPGCVRGLIHALDYHHWNYNVKKMLSHKGHDKQKLARRRGNPRTILNLNDSGELKSLLDGETSHFFVGQRTSKTSSTNRRSLKSRVKALIAEDTAKKDTHQRRSSGFPAQPSLQRTYSIHHLEPSDHSLGEIGSDWKHPIIFFPSSTDISAIKWQDPAQSKGTDKPAMCRTNYDLLATDDITENLVDNQTEENYTLPPEKCGKAREELVNDELMQVNQMSRNVADHQDKENLDVLEIFKVNKESFVEVLQNTEDRIAERLQNLQDSNSKARLTKSGSFPAADLSRSRNFRPSKLKHKQNEIWSFPKGEKLVAGSPAPKSVVSKFSRTLSTKSGPLMTDDSGDGLLNQETNFFSFCPIEELEKRGSNCVGERRKFDGKEGKKDNSDPSEYSLSTGLNEMLKGWNEGKIEGEGKDNSRTYTGTNASEYGFSYGSNPTHRRASSLNESLDRYTKLFEHICRKEDNWNRSNSLKLTNVYENSSGGHASISFRRNHSLPHLDFQFPLPYEVSNDIPFSLMPSRITGDSTRNIERGNQDEPVGLSETAEKFLPLDDNEVTEYPKNMVERSETSLNIQCSANLKVGTHDDSTTNEMSGHDKEMDGQTFGKSNSCTEKEMTSEEISNTELPEPSSSAISESLLNEQVTSTSNIPIPEYNQSSLENTCNNLKEKESSVYLENDSFMDSSSWSCSSVNNENSENASQRFNNHVNMEIRTKDNDDFNYMREILERSGFTGNGFYDPWHSSGQLLNPLVFDELEARWPHEKEFSGDGIYYCHHHLLLFDLANEALLRIYDRSFTYYPRALSGNCHIRPMPLGCHLLEESWASASRYLSLKTELNQPLDVVVAQDFTEDDGWMNLQLETECVALELEDLIFDELLEELISF